MMMMMMMMTRLYNIDTSSKSTDNKEMIGCSS